MPLCTILVKWPAPLGPQCSQPVSGAGASARRKGSTRCTASTVPPTISP